MPFSAGPNKWNSTPRKVFDAVVERIYLKINRARDSCRQDYEYLAAQITALEERLHPLEDGPKPSSEKE